MINNYIHLFEQDYTYIHVADQTIAIGGMIKYFLNSACHNQYYITNIISHIVYYTYDLVKFMDETDVTTKLGYYYTIRTLKAMYVKVEPNSFHGHENLLVIYKQYLDIEINSNS